jgi:hypothetical protein
MTSKTTFGVLLLAWFNLTMLPCAMAAGDIADRTGSSMGRTQMMPSPHMQHAAMDAPPCVTLQSECCDLGQVIFGDSTPKFEKKPGVATGLLAAPAYSELRPPTLRRVWQPSDPPDLGGGWPRLHVIHCVYLD